MAIVRRPLCSGGGHFLRGWAGAGGRKRSAEAQTPRQPQPGVRGDGHSPGAPGVGPPSRSRERSWAQRSPLGARFPSARFPRKLRWRSWKAGGQRKVLRPRAAPPHLPSVPDPWQGVTGSKRTITASGRTQVPGCGNPTPTASLQQQEDLGLQVGTQSEGNRAPGTTHVVQASCPSFPGWALW